MILEKEYKCSETSFPSLYISGNDTTEDDEIVLEFTSSYSSFSLCSTLEKLERYTALMQEAIKDIKAGKFIGPEL